MSSTGKIITAVVIVAVIAGGAWLLTNKKSDDKTSQNAGSTTQNQASDDATNTGSDKGNDNGNEAIDVSIKYDGTSFTLSADAIKAGGTVRLTNDSQEDLMFESNPHPGHTDNPELNAGEIAPGDSKTFKLETKGVWGFHNHLNPSQKGELRVE